ncbi:PREDICTED: CLK4-associating serine/arginine rich protein-like [Condylura cristata]|uniref:CLK4-associating serine/arginine rich protein-like n=1 Tax=Condylura cristata TaxID=143302 RepID=UPI00064294CD|nr:PREDICTED: CLK4-associating serine/arginine rich protein-like [Condylura cristata]
MRNGNKVSRTRSPLESVGYRRKVLTLGKPDPAPAGSPHTPSLSISEPRSSQGELRGFWDTWNLSLRQKLSSLQPPLPGADPVERIPHPRPQPPSSAKGGGKEGAAHSSLPGAADTELGALGASRRLSLGCAGVQALPATPTATRFPRSLPPAPPAGARTPGLRHVGAREAAAAAAAAGAQDRAGEIALHAAGSVAAFRSASGRSSALQARKAGKRRRTRTGAGVPRVGASGAVSRRARSREEATGSLPRSFARWLTRSSSRCWGFQAARCCCAPPRRRPAEASRSGQVHASPRSANESGCIRGARARQLQPKRAPSLKSVPSAANFPGSSSPRRSLRQPWERCAPSRAPRPLPTRHPWDRLPSAAPLGALSLHHVAGSGARSPRCLADPARQSAGVSCVGSVQTLGFFTWILDLTLG